MIIYMKRTGQDNFQVRKNNLFFGSTAAVITNLGILTGLYGASNPKATIIAGILVIGIADNISDTLGIHIYQEAEGIKSKKVWLYSLGNYASRLAVSFLFVFFVAVLPIPLALGYSLAVGFLLIALISFSIARHNKTNPVLAIIEHLAVALLVIVVSRFLGNFIINRI
jgi:vacuolar iron transporter family protein